MPGFADGRGPTGPVTLKIVAPAADEIIPVPQPEAGQPPAKGAPVTLKVELANFELFEDDATKSGQHLEILVDNISSTFPWRDATKPYTFKSLPKGTHTVRIFPVRPWGEAIKEPSALAMVTFHVGEKDGKNTVEPGYAGSHDRLPARQGEGRDRKGPSRRPRYRAARSPSRPCPIRAASATSSTRSPRSRSRRSSPSGSRGLTPGRHAYVVGLTREQKVVPGAFALYQGSFEVENGANPAAPASAPPAKATGQ